MKVSQVLNDRKLQRTSYVTMLLIVVLGWGCNMDRAKFKLESGLFWFGFGLFQGLDFVLAQVYKSGNQFQPKDDDTYI